MLISRWVPWLWPICIGGTFSFGASAQSSDQGSITRKIYDVQWALTRPRSYPYRPFGLGKWFHVPKEVGDQVEVEGLVMLENDGGGLACWSPGLELQDLVSNIKLLTGEKYWYGDGVGLDSLDSGYLIVRASLERHSQVHKVLRWCKECATEVVTYELHRLPGSAMTGNPVLLSKAAADALVAQVESHLVAMQTAIIGTEARIGSVEARDVVGVPSAHANEFLVTPNPSVVAVGVGMDGVVWSGSGAGDRVAVYLDVGFAGDLGDAPAINVLAGLWSGGDSGGSVVSGSGRMSLRLPRTSLSVLSTGGMLADGEALLVGDTRASGVAYCLRVRRGKRAMNGLGEVAAFPVGHIVRQMRLPVLIGGEGVMYGAAGLESPMLDEGRLQDIIKTNIKTDSWDGSPNDMCMMGDCLYVRADAETIALVADIVKDFDAGAQRQFDVEVRHGRVKGEDLRFLAAPTGKTLVDRLAGSACRGLVRNGAGLSVLVGEWRSILSDYEPVVAGESVMQVPVVREVFDGVHVVCRFAADDEGGGTLSVGFTESSIMGEVENRPLCVPADPGAPRGGAVQVSNGWGDVQLAKVWSQSFRMDRPVKLGEWVLVRAVPVAETGEHSVVFARVQEVR